MLKKDESNKTCFVERIKKRLLELYYRALTSFIFYFLVQHKVFEWVLHHLFKRQKYKRH